MIVNAKELLYGNQPDRSMFDSLFSRMVTALPSHDLSGFHSTVEMRGDLLSEFVFDAMDYGFLSGYEVGKSMTELSGKLNDIAAEYEKQFLKKQDGEKIVRREIP